VSAPDERAAAPAPDVPADDAPTDAVEVLPADVDGERLAATLTSASARAQVLCEIPVRGPLRRHLPLLARAGDAPLAAYHEIGAAVDKYAMRALPAIDCEARLPLCRARCCTLRFALSRQDLDEGVVRWDPARPYAIAQREDRTCVHLHAGRCEVYAQRPAVCRSYDCRGDGRIWLDFDTRIPAP
jgi:Fe-S-cluster containining protein